MAVPAIEQIRLAEIQLVRRLFPPSGRVLEIGGGTGYQASVIAGWGYQVDSIDIRTSTAFFPVKLYDGEHIPVPEGRFDLVFSSNVLEHIPPLKLSGLLAETRRVLKKGARSIHLLPTPTWRLWTSLLYYRHVCLKLLDGVRVGCGDLVAGSQATPIFSNQIERQLAEEKFRRIVDMLGLPLRPHGEYPSALAELYCFRRRHWERIVVDAKFHVVVAEGSSLFYTGHSTSPSMWPTLTIRSRRRCRGFGQRVQHFRSGIAGRVWVETATLSFSTATQTLTSYEV